MSQPSLPPGRAIKLKLDSDGAIKRGFMAVIGLYLIVALALPLYAMLSKSFVTYSFDLARYEFQVSDAAGSFDATAPETALAINTRLNVVSADDLRSSSDGRLAATLFFPDFSFRSPEKYRIRGLDPDAPYLVGLDLQNSTNWQEYDSNTFRRINLRPVKSVGAQNYVEYFSNPALFSSIQNSVFIAVVSTVLTVIAAFGFAYALNRSLMPFKGFFKLVAMMPILVPSLLPGIALIYLFGNQGMLKGVLMGQSIYGPLGIVIGSVFFTFP
ncbi:MAG: putative 2-aminoethylphosphonate ABC transporter permease subunit, partial [Pseudorhodobacter sp.]